MDKLIGVLISWCACIGDRCEFILKDERWICDNCGRELVRGRKR